jgi:hypothetical protein
VPVVACEENKELPDRLIAFLSGGARYKYYAVADYREIFLARGFDKGDGKMLMEMIAYAVPVKVEVIKTPDGPTYRVVWKDKFFGCSLFEGSLKQIAMQIRRNYLIMNSRWFFRVLRVIINEMIGRGLGAIIYDSDREPS